MTTTTSAVHDPGRPGPDEMAPSSEAYVRLVPSGSVIETLRAQLGETRALLGRLEPARAEYRYAEGKWTVRQVLQHMVDGERILAFRLLCIARGETQGLPGYDENVYAATTG